MRARTAAACVVVGVACMGPLFAFSSGMCERQKGRGYMSAYNGRSDACIGQCQVRVVEVDGPYARWEVTGALCAYPRRVAPPVAAARPEARLEPEGRSNARVYADDPDGSKARAAVVARLVCERNPKLVQCASF